jgi:hypothetical protein
MRLVQWMLILILAGCSHQPKRVECDQHLVPINLPAPVVKEAPLKPANSP